MTTDNTNLPDKSDPASPGNCLLTIALPVSLQEEVLDLLRSHADVVPGFSVVPGHGMGQGASLTTMMERVEGRARRVLVYVVMNTADVDVLLLRMRGAFQSKEVFYWAVPLLASGRLT